MHDVGVVVPTLGQRLAWLEVCLGSIRSQGRDVAIVIVAPVRSDVETLGRKYDAEFVTDPRRGLSGAINAGFASLGPIRFKTWLGDDDILAPRALELARTALENSPRAAYAFGKTRYVDSNGRSIYSAITGNWAPRYMRFGQDYIPQPGSLIRSEAITWSPALDETLKNAMDLDLFLRLSLPGPSSWVFVNTELSAYRIHDDAITQTKGGMDESAAVRMRYSRVGRVGNAPGVRPLRRFCERAFIYCQWHRRKSSSWVEAGSWTFPELAPTE